MKHCYIPVPYDKTVHQSYRQLDLARNDQRQYAESELSSRQVVNGVADFGNALKRRITMNSEAALFRSLSSVQNQRGKGRVAPVSSSPLVHA